MDFRYKLANILFSVSAFGLNLLGRKGNFFPGKVAIKFDKDYISKIKDSRIDKSVVVVGTNGKTTSTNLIANLLESNDKSVICNRSGANLDSGIAVALRDGKKSDWGVFECDEFFLYYVAAQLKPNYVILTNLFPDQLDRYGSVSNIQQNIILAFKQSPKTCVIYNSDDPNCEYILSQVENPRISFGVEGGEIEDKGEFKHLELCPNCGELLKYSKSTYDQLGIFACKFCSFKSQPCDFFAKNIKFNKEDNNSFDVYSRKASRIQFKLNSKFDVFYMVYNFTAICAFAAQVKIKSDAINDTINKFSSGTGRYESFKIAGKSVFTNLAKNSAGFNQNLSLLNEKLASKNETISAGFFINNNTGDGVDFSWIWAANFEQLSKYKNLKVFVGGSCANKLIERLEYAYISAIKVESLSDVLNYSEKENEIFILANYTALPPIHTEAAKYSTKGFKPKYNEVKFRELPELKSVEQRAKLIRIACLYFDILDLYSDQFNSVILQKYFYNKGINSKLEFLSAEESYHVEDYDVFVVGEGCDLATKFILKDMKSKKPAFKQAIESDKFFLCVGKSFRLFGREVELSKKKIQGLDILEVPQNAQCFIYKNFYGVSKHGPILFMNDGFRKEFTKKLKKSFF